MKDDLKYLINKIIGINHRVEEAWKKNDVNGRKKMRKSLRIFNSLVLKGKSCVVACKKQEKSVLPLIYFKLTNLYRFVWYKIEILAKSYKSIFKNENYFELFIMEMVKIKIVERS